MLNKALKQIRVFHQLKQGELAKLLDISNSYLSEIESGAKPVSVELLNKYGRVFSVPASSLLVFSENYGKTKLSSQLRAKCADKIIKVMEWMNSRYEVES